jgi:DNA-binding CsgD family transcriptional regulator
VELNEEDYLAHYGILRKSGRYPWGSGATQEERNRTFLSTIEDLRVNHKLSDTEIARGFGMTTTQLRASRSIAKNAEKQGQINMAQRLKDKGYSNVAIGQRMELNESSVRALLAPGAKDKADILETTSNMLKDAVEEKHYVDIGSGVEHHLGVSSTKLSTAVARLQEEGYTVHYVKVEQLGTGQQTTIKVLARPDTPYSEVYRNRDNIKQVTSYSEDGGRTYNRIQPPISIDSKRVSVRYANEGGADADGVIYVRPGVKDVSLGASRYAQVRVAVDGTHYLKGMAMYKDDLPAGTDLQFNTNKKETGNKLDAMKPMKDDPDNPFGASISRQIGEDGPDGKKRVTSVMNIVNEEGDWENWSRSLSSQMLSKQSPALAKTQLDMTLSRKKNELEEIQALDNPAVKRKLLESYADDADSSAVHLKAAALPRQGSHVILPVNSMKETEVYAPNFRDGERVVLVRYPHGGIFEIPELTVNNRHPEAKKLLGNAKDAIGIHSKVAERLSGADFDGDTVLVIPNNSRKVKTEPALEGLKGFDPQRAYPGYEGMTKMSARTKAIEMGIISNLITDMTIRGATSAEKAQAVRHSMVVIDAEKHGLDWKRSATDNGISRLKEKYQGRKNAGASTVISRASAEVRVPERKARPAAEGGPIDRVTGKKVFEETGNTYTNRAGKTVVKTVQSKKLAETDDAHTLSSGTPIEKIYADHSNKLKDLANQARLEAINTKTTPYSPAAKVKYADQVKTLEAKLNLALRNSPLERQAQVIANSVVTQKRNANPDMEPSEIKKLKAQALTEARNRTGAKKTRIEISDDEWTAIQAGAISTNRLHQILNNADLDKVKQLATPKSRDKLNSGKVNQAIAMLRNGYTQAEVADQLGVSVSTLKRNLSEGGA